MVYVLIGGEKRCLSHLREAVLPDNKSRQTGHTGHASSSSVPIPVVVCKGTGLAADLISFVYEHENKNYDSVEFRKEMNLKIHELFGGQSKRACQTLIMHTMELIKKHKTYIQVFDVTTKINKSPFVSNFIRSNDEFNFSDEFNFPNSQQKDDFCDESLEWLILLAAIKSRNKNPISQLDLAQRWNRTDIAKQFILPRISSLDSERVLQQALFDSLVYRVVL